MKRYSLLLILLSFTFQNLFSQNIVIQGKVRHANTYVDIPYVNIYIKGTDRGTTSNSMGEFKLELSTPQQITAAGGIYQYQGKITTPDTLSVHFEFEKLPVVWRHRLWGATEYNSEVNNGIFLFGDEATVFASDRRWVVIPKGASDKREEFKVPSDMGTLHMANFLECVLK